jgi:hypothetical protein
MSDKERNGVLATLDTKTKVFGLIALVLEASFLGSLAVLPKSQVIYGLLIAGVVFVVLVIALIALEKAEARTESRQQLTASPLTPDSPLLDSIIKGAMHTVCRGVTVPRTPEEATLRAFIFRKQGDSLVCTHFWAPESMIVKENVGLTFPLRRELADRVAIVRAYFDAEPARTAVSVLSEEAAGVKGEVSDQLTFVLAVPIFDDRLRNKIWGVVDLDSSNEIGRSLLSTTVSDNVMWHLAEHLRLLFSLVETKK